VIRVLAIKKEARRHTLDDEHDARLPRTESSQRVSHIFEFPLTFSAFPEIGPGTRGLIFPGFDALFFSAFWTTTRSRRNQIHTKSKFPRHLAAMNRSGPTAAVLRLLSDLKACQDEVTLCRQVFSTCVFFAHLRFKVLAPISILDSRSFALCMACAGLQRWTRE
jgi:hypothetical protein